ncbi:hypothetical protein T10_13187, partial [Trichinella papuae]
GLNYLKWTPRSLEEDAPTTSSAWHPGKQGPSWLLVNPGRATSLPFLGHTVDANGIRPLPTKSKQSKPSRHPKPGVSSADFSALRFLPHIATTLALLDAIASAAASTRIILTHEQLEAFNAAKDALANATMLHHPPPRQLIKHFHHAVEGQRFMFYTDHKAAGSALIRPSNNLNDRETRHLDLNMSLTDDVRHISGSINVVADALSQNVNALLPATSNHSIAADVAWAQSVDPDLHQIAQATSFRLQPQEIPNSPFPLHVPPRASTCWYRYASSYSVPSAACHTLASAQLSIRVAWHTRRRRPVDSGLYQLPVCQNTVAHALTASGIPLTRALIRARPSGHHGATPTVRWLQPIHDITASTVARTCLTNWIARFSVPSNVATGKGQQFSSHTWATLKKMFGCQHISVSAYHPQANGIVERFRRHLKASLIAHMHSTWAKGTTALPLVLLGIRTALKEDLNCLTAEMLYGSVLPLAADFFLSDATTSCSYPTAFADALTRPMQRLRPTAPRHRVQNPFIHGALAHYSHVFVQEANRMNSLVPLYFCPHTCPGERLVTMGACLGTCNDRNRKRLLGPTPDILPGNGSGRMARDNGRFFHFDWRTVLASSRQPLAVKLFPPGTPWDIYWDELKRRDLDTYCQASP